MICRNCNAQIGDSAAFCPMCGAKCAEEPAPQQAYSTAAVNEQPAENPQAYEGEAVQNADVPADNTQTYAEYQQYAPGQNTAGYEGYIPAEDPSSVKKGRGKIALVAVIAAVLIIAIAGGVFGKTIFFAIAPETYVAGLAANTIETMVEELDSIEKNIFGFDMAADKDFTLSADIRYNDGTEETKVKASVANLPDKEKLLFEGSFANDYGKASLNGFWDNENIGVMTVGTDGEYLSVPSKDFGEEFENSGGYASGYIYEEDEDVYDILTSLDLSYKTLYENATGKSDLAKRTSKHYYKNLVKLLKKGNVGERESVKYEFDDGKVNARKITLSLDTKNMYDFLINSLEDIKNDDKLKEDINRDAFKKSIKQLKEEKKEADNVDYDIEVIEYKGKLVSLSFTMEEDESEYWDNYSSSTTITYSATDRKHFLSGIDVENRNEYKYSDNDSSEKFKGETLYKSGIESNWITEDEEINITLYNSYSYTDKDDDDSDWYESESEAELYIDYGKEKWNVKVKDTYSGSESGKESNINKYKGTCSKKGGFSFKIDEEWEEEVYINELSYDEWMETGYSEWLGKVYEENRDDYLNYVYEEHENFYYDFNTFGDWFKVYGSVWDVPDSDFENWLYDYEYLYDRDSVYEEETRKVEKKDAYLKADISLKPKAELKYKKADLEDILEWEKDDFEDFAENAEKEFKKKK